MRLQQNRGGGTHLLVGGSSLLTLLILGAMVFPALPQSAQAEEATSKVELTVNPVISISLQNALNVDVLPTQDGTFSSNTAALSISTNNETGYSLYMATGNGKNTLTSQNPGTSDVISAVNGGDNGVTSSNFGNNTWGYNLSQEAVSDATAYKAVPTATGDTALISTSSPTEADTYNLTFGTKVDTSLPSGTYSNDVVVSVVANPEYVPTISAMTNMQDVTAEICAASADGETATLIDTRDGSDYTVAKINGNCWMTSNLRLSGGRKLTSADSDVGSDWEFPDNSLTAGNSYTEARFILSDDPRYATEYGGYYNYCAASAGSVCAQTEMDATQSICPKGWRLPTYSEMSGIRSYVSAFSLVYSGYYSNGSLGYTGYYGHWWSATADSSSKQYNLHNYNESLYTNGEYKNLGYSVRCIRSNPGTLTINFDGNGSTGGSTASQQIAAGNTASLNANGFTRTGYAFTGWNTAADGSGTSYADGVDYTVTPATGDATLTLYAQWAPSMQDFTLAQCQSLASDANYTVVDSRDGSDYTVRYINGTCWMTQNLRLSGGRTLTSADSNVTSDWEFPNNSLTLGNSYTEARSILSDNSDPDTALEYGGYYNICAASAGTVCNDTTEQDATQDICPKGWRLPTRTKQDGITSYVSSFSPVYSGAYSNGALHNTGSRGYWWSATAYNSANQYNLVYSSGSLHTSGINKYNGLSVRCVRSS